MDIKTYEQLKAKIERMKTEKAKAEGKREAALAALQSLGFADVNAAQEGLAALELAIERKETAQKRLLAELDGLTDWSKI